MNERALKTLEYDKIIELLTEKASCDLGRMQCQQLLPMHDLEEVRLAQRQTADALRRIYAKGSISFSGTRSVGDSLKRLEKSDRKVPEILWMISSMRWNLAFLCLQKSDAAFFLKKKSQMTPAEI